MFYSMCYYFGLGALLALRLVALVACLDTTINMCYYLGLGAFVSFRFVYLLLFLDITLNGWDWD